MTASIGSCHLQSKEQFWLADPAPILEEPFTSCLKCKTPWRQTLSANKHKNCHGVDSEAYPECGLGKWNCIWTWPTDTGLYSPYILPLLCLVSVSVLAFPRQCDWNVLIWLHSQVVNTFLSSYLSTPAVSKSRRECTKWKETSVLLTS